MKKAVVGRSLSMLALFTLAVACARNADTGGASAGAAGKGVKPAPLPVLSRKDSLSVWFFFDGSDPNTDQVISKGLEPLKQAFGAKIKWEFVPVVWGKTESQVSASRLMAVGVDCAQKQGKALEFLREARKAGQTISEAGSSTIAARIGLNSADFTNCWKGTDPRVLADQNASLASARLVRSVPALIIEDAVLFGGAVNEEVYKRVAQSYLNDPGSDTVTLFVFYDPTCRVCVEEISHSIVSTYDNVVPIRISVDRPENKQLALSLGIDRVPAYAFKGPVKSLKDYKKLESLLRPISGQKDLYDIEVSFSAGVRKLLVPLPKFREDNAIGDPKAPVTVYDFSDFQCPACRNLAQNILPAIKGPLLDSGKARWVYLHFPLKGHEYSFPAATASECAAQQGKFWPYHDLLFANQGSLSRELLFNLATRLPGLSTEKFTACMSDRRVQDVVAGDLRLAEKLKLPGTPSLIIGSYLTGSRPAEEIIYIVEVVAGEQSESAG
ncbi:MAG: DsbA family protein [bacterium JZ-2024 1]